MLTQTAAPDYASRFRHRSRSSRPKTSADARPAASTFSSSSIISHSSTDNLATAKTLKALLEAEETSTYDLAVEPPLIHAIDLPENHDILCMEQLFNTATKRRFTEIASRDPHDHSKYRRVVFEGGWRDQLDVWEQSDSHRPRLPTAPLVLNRYTLASILRLGEVEMGETNEGGEAGDMGDIVQPNVKLASASAPLPHHTRPASTAGDRQSVLQCNGTTYVSASPRLISFTPLAINHPVRVWDEMLASLGPDTAPLVKWNVTWSQIGQGILHNRRADPSV